MVLYPLFFLNYLYMFFLIFITEKPVKCAILKHQISMMKTLIWCYDKVDMYPFLLSLLTGFSRHLWVESFAHWILWELSQNNHKMWKKQHHKLSKHPLKTLLWRISARLWHQIHKHGVCFWITVVKTTGTISWYLYFNISFGTLNAWVLLTCES